MNRKGLKLIDAEQQIINTVLDISSKHDIMKSVDPEHIRDIINFFLENQFKENQSKTKRFIDEKIEQMAKDIIDKDIKGD